MANIYEKMSAITQEIATVYKNLNVGEGKNAYKAVSEADVLEAVKPIEAKHGVFSFPIGRDILESAVLTTSGEYRDGTKYEKKQQYMRLGTVYRFINIENPDEYVDVQTYGDGVDPQDKAPGKAMTYADKYALMKAYKITTGDDPDQKASEDLKEKETKPAMASEKQIAYIQRLHDQSPEAAAYIEKACPDPNKLTKKLASEIIGHFKDEK